MCTTSLGVSVVPEVWVSSAGRLVLVRVNGRRCASGSRRSGVAPSASPVTRKTRLQRLVTSGGSSPTSFFSSVIRCGQSQRSSSSATTSPVRLGERATGTAPTRATAQVSRKMSKPSSL